MLRFYLTRRTRWQDRKVRRDAKEHADARLDPHPALVIEDCIGTEERKFDPLTDELDQITYHEALSSSVEEHRAERQGLSRQIAQHPSALASITIGGLLILADLQANNFFLATTGVAADQRPFIAVGLTALNVVIAAVATALMKGTPE